MCEEHKGRSVHVGGDGVSETAGGEDDEEDECSIHDLRLRGTNVGDVGVSHLHALRRITVLDLSLCGGVFSLQKMLHLYPA